MLSSDEFSVLVLAVDAATGGRPAAFSVDYARKIITIIDAPPAGCCVTIIERFQRVTAMAQPLPATPTRNPLRKVVAPPQQQGFPSRREWWNRRR